MFAGGGTARKAYYEGTHRLTRPDETIARIRPLLATFGITRVANLTGLDRTGVPVVMVCRPNARSSAVFHGKGMDLGAAKASGLMEAVETWHAERVALPLRFAALGEFGRPTVEIEGLPRRPSSVFDPDRPILWIEGDELISGGKVWLPFEVVHADATVAGPPASGCFAASTNGLASGNHLLEAVSHALCEIIERDATSLWHRLAPVRQDATRVDLDSLDDAACRMVLDRLAAAHLDIGVWETTTDVGVPAFQCMLAEGGAAVGHVGHGAGCHPVPEIALLRALTEAAQVRTTYIAGSREDIEHDDYRPSVLQRRHGRARALMRPVDRMRDFRRCARFDCDTFDGEVAWLLQRLRHASFRQVVVVDLTRPEYGIPVVRVVVPGLEGSDHHREYVPGGRALAQDLEARR